MNNNVKPLGTTEKKYDNNRGSSKFTRPQKSSAPQQPKEKK